MNDNEIGNPPVKALIVFRENGDTDNLFVPILCDAIRTTGIDVRCSTNEFWNSDTPYDIIHFQWPEEVTEGSCDDPDRICRLEERIAFFRSRGARFVYTRHNVRPHDADEVTGRAYDIIEEQSDVVVHMGRYSRDEFAAKHADSRNVIIPHPIYQYTYKEDISMERARQYLNLPQEAFIVTSFGKFRNREERRMVTGAFRKWDEAKKFLLAPRLYPFSRFNRYGSNFFKRWTSRTGYYLLIPLLNRLRRMHTGTRMHAGASDEPIDNSVVIPVYNTEKYVREAVESIMNQTLRELEIIIINDGSTDNSLQVAEELAAADSRIQVYSQTNRGLSMARNAGITHAHGRYIYFMDSDDLLEKDAMELCYSKCEEKELDFVFFDAQSFFEEDIRNAPALNYQRTDKLEDKVYTGPEAINIQLQHKTYTPSACLNVIRTAFLEERQLLFYPDIVHEDQLFTTLLYLQTRRTSCIQRSFFHRRIRKNSIMTCDFSLQNLKGYLTVAQEIVRFKQQTSEYEIRNTIDLYLSQMLNAVIWQAHVLPYPYRLRLAWRCLFRYKKLISIRSIGVLLFKSIIHK